MAMPVGRAESTVDMLDALPDDGQRYELIDGELFVTPASSDVHQLVVLELGSRLKRYLRPSAVGRALISPADVRRGDPKRNRVQPDVFVVRLDGGARPSYPFTLSDLLLAVEVDSPQSLLRPSNEARAVSDSRSPRILDRQSSRANVRQMVDAQ